jgi:hypothetical protein
MLWNGTSAAVDLTPVGMQAAEAYATNGVEQVGVGVPDITTNVGHALLWHGTADATDLGALLPSSTFVNSRAYAIDADGNVYGLATDTAGFEHAIEWVVVPEPTGLAALAAMAGVLVVRRRSRRMAS